MIYLLYFRLCFIIITLGNLFSLSAIVVKNTVFKNKQGQYVHLYYDVHKPDKKTNNEQLKALFEHITTLKENLGKNKKGIKILLEASPDTYFFIDTGHYFSKQIHNFCASCKTQLKTIFDNVGQTRAAQGSMSDQLLTSAKVYSKKFPELLLLDTRIWLKRRWNCLMDQALYISLKKPKKTDILLKKSQEYSGSFEQLLVDTRALLKDTIKKLTFCKTKLKAKEFILSCDNVLKCYKQWLTALDQIPQFSFKIFYKRAIQAIDNWYWHCSQKHYCRVNNHHPTVKYFHACLGKACFEFYQNVMIGLEDLYNTLYDPLNINFLWHILTQENIEHIILIAGVGHQELLSEILPKFGYELIYDKLAYTYSNKPVRQIIPEVERQIACGKLHPANLLNYIKPMTCSAFSDILSYTNNCSKRAFDSTGPKIDKSSLMPGPCTLPISTKRKSVKIGFSAMP